MGRIEEMKKEYDRIPIPAELSVRVQAEIEKSRIRQLEKNRSCRLRRCRKVAGVMGGLAAGVCIVFTMALNTNAAFAKETAQLPVIGGLARVLTFRSYEEEKDDIGISVEIPTIDMIAEDIGTTADEINQEIYDLCDRYANEAVMRAEEYRTAFFDTGGTQEEWEAHKIKIKVTYEIKQQGSRYLSFVVWGTESWVSAYNESRYYNLDLRTGEMVTLEDMLGENYVEQINDSIREQIEERQKNGEVFFTESEGGFTGISEDVKFYINESERPVIVFEKYEIAPGASGEIEFEIGGKG